MGFSDCGGISGYYPDSDIIGKADIHLVQDFLLSRGGFLQNTRLRISKVGDEKKFEVLVASAETSKPAEVVTPLGSPDVGEITFTFGDHSSELNKILESLRGAAKYVRNENQKTYIEQTMRCLRTGSIPAHKEASVAWVKDLSPEVETFIGFMEAYRDPGNVWCEGEGVVAIQNTERTKVFNDLADRAENLIKGLPWTGVSGGAQLGEMGEFENPKFEMPDFVSLENKQTYHLRHLNIYLTLLSPIVL